MKKKRSGLPDILVGLVCFSGALLMGYLFWKDLNRTLIKISEVPVASITYKRNGAQRRFQERLIWGAVQKGSPVYNGDLIRTADLSDAVVTFEAGVKIDLSENSLIQAFYDAGAGLRVELSGGSITVDTEGAGLVVSSGGREVSVSPGSSVSLDSNIETGGLSIKVAEGGALAGTAEGLREIGAGAAMTIAGEGQIEEKPQVTVIFPPANHRILNGEKAPGEVSFAFKTTGFTGAEKVRLDLAEDRRFSRIVQTLEDPSGAALTTRLAPGTWWWRAYAVTEGQAAPSGDSPPPAAVPPDAARGRIYIVYAPGPELRLPAEGERFRYQNAPPESPGGPETRDAAPLILFRWSSRAGDQADAYFLLIADNRELLNPVIAETVEGFSFTSDSLTEGTWYWRVSALYEGGNPDAVPVSGTASFSIVREPAAGAAPPAIAAPAPANEAYRDEAGESPKTPPVNPVRITEKNPSDINISPKAPARPRALPIPLLGRPEALMPAGDSQIDADYILRNPEPRPGPAGEAPFTGMLFRWNSVAGANAYTFSLLREGSTEPLVRSGYSPKTEYLLRDMSFLENGVYVWRVEALRIASN
ncbi:MAG: FecR family protein, partial [Treponema sp.]|nr:FecR family protein [Treponema sp.]